MSKYKVRGIIQREREREGERQRQRDRERDRDRQTDRQTDRALLTHSSFSTRFKSIPKGQVYSPSLPTALGKPSHSHSLYWDTSGLGRTKHDLAVSDA